MASTVAQSGMRAPRKARTIIDSLLANRMLTPDGLNWLTIATDPFHDTALRPAGYPDINSSNTITQCFTFTANIVAPAAAGVLPWDCHVWLAPLSALTGATQTNTTAVLNMYNYFPKQGLITPIATSPSVFPGYNCMVMPTGTDWQNLVPAGNVTAGSVNLGFPGTCNGGQFRLVAAGFEVVNTTPDLYRGGAVTCYRAPSRVDPAQYLYISGLTTPFVTNQGYLPPSTQANAQLYPGSRTWAAEDGAYGIATLSSDKNSFVDASMNLPSLTTPCSNAQIQANTPVPLWTYQPFVNAAGIGYVATTCQILPFDCHGAMFVGLNTNSTLQVTTKYFVERIPTFNEPDLLVLARPPTPYDPIARELYTRTIMELPVAVPVAENPLGEWFNDVLETVAEFAPTVGKVFGPLGMVLGKGIGAGAQTWLDSRAPPKKKKNKKKKTPNIQFMDNPLYVPKKQKARPSVMPPIGIRPNRQNRNRRARRQATM